MKKALATMLMLVLVISLIPLGSIQTAEAAQIGEITITSIDVSINIPEAGAALGMSTGVTCNTAGYTGMVSGFVTPQPGGSDSFTLNINLLQSGYVLSPGCSLTVRYVQHNGAGPEVVQTYGTMADYPLGSGTIAGELLAGRKVWSYPFPLSYQAPKAELSKISAIDLTMSFPKPSGGALPTTVACNTAGYTASIIEWRYLGNTVTAYTPENNDNSYWPIVRVTPEAGYTFDPESMVTFRFKGYGGTGAEYASSQGPIGDNYDSNNSCTYREWLNGGGTYTWISFSDCYYGYRNVYYNYNGGSVAANSGKLISYQGYGESFAEIELPRMEKTNYRFVSWQYDFKNHNPNGGSGGTALSYSNEIAPFMPYRPGASGGSAITRLYLLAIYAYELSFDSNGGAGTMSPQTITETYGWSDSSGGTASIKPNAFTRARYSFAGWNTKADGTGTAYPDGASFPYSAFNGHTTLYAQWSQETGYTILIPDGDSVAIDPETRVGVI